MRITTSAAGPDPTSVSEWFRRRAARDSAAPALSFESRHWNYGELQTQIERLSAVLAEGGVRRGDRVACLCFNNPITPTTLMAASRLGAIFVSLNFRLNAEELKAVITDAGVHTLIADERHAAIIEGFRENLPCTRFFALENPLAEWEALPSCLARVSEVPEAVAANAEDLAMIMYTSGTTGKPKGVMMSNDNLWFATLSGVLTIDFTSRDVTLIALPLFHAAGLCMLLLPTLMAGAHAVLLQEFDADRVLSELEHQRITVSMLVPTMMLAISNRPRFADADLTALRLIIAGAAPVPEPLLRRFEGRGIPVSHCYGMTESTSLVSSLAPDKATSKIGSCGRPTMMTEFRLVDADGHELTQPGERGEVCIRGRSVTSGYWQQPDSSSSALRDGWLHSGDIAWRDEEGYYYICDRLKDMIITGGENVYPAEVESVLLDHPAVGQVAVIGLPDEKWGERVVAVVVPAAEQRPELESLRGFAEARLARYKLPSALFLIDAMPLNSSGKLLKSELRRRFGSP